MTYFPSGDIIFGHLSSTIMSTSRRKNFGATAENSYMMLRSQEQSGGGHKSFSRTPLSEVSNVVEGIAGTSLTFINNQSNIMAKKNKLRAKVSHGNSGSKVLGKRASTSTCVSITSKKMRQSSAADLSPKCISARSGSLNVKIAESSKLALRCQRHPTKLNPMAQDHGQVGKCSRHSSVIRQEDIEPSVHFESDSASKFLKPLSLTTQKSISTCLPPQRKSPSKKLLPSINPKDDVDLAYKECLWMVPSYAQNIFAYLLTLECKVSQSTDTSNVGIPSDVRAQLVDRLALAYIQMQLLQETFQLSVILLDRFLSVEKTPDDCLILVALSCLSLSIKYEEMFQVSIKKLLSFAGPSYTKMSLLKMEATVLKALNFQVSRPVAITFLRRFNIAIRSNRVQHCYGKFLIDLAQYNTFLARCKASHQAAAAAFLAVCIVKKDYNTSYWNELLRYYSTLSWTEIQLTVEQLAAFAVSSGSECCQIHKKYSTTESHSVAKNVMPQLIAFQKH